jgi:uncharacterized membrane protein
MTKKRSQVVVSLSRCCPSSNQKRDCSHDHGGSVGACDIRRSGKFWMTVLLLCSQLTFLPAAGAFQVAPQGGERVNAVSVSSTPVTACSSRYYMYGPAALPKRGIRIIQSNRYYHTAHSIQYHVRQKRRSNRSETTVALKLSPATNILAKVSFVEKGIGLLYLLMATTVGLVSEARYPYVSDKGIGILITLAFASVLSNTGLVPSVHPGYDLAWTTFLPASLAFLLLSSSGTSSDSDNDVALGGVEENTSSTATATDIISSRPRPSSHSVWKRIRNVGIAFAFASAASALGCLCSFQLCCAASPMTRTATSGVWMWKLPPRFCLPPHLAALVAGCLCASYIGGSVNLFATAQFVLSTMPHIYKGSGGSDVLSAVAGSDLATMAVYFAALTWMNGNQSLNARFRGRGKLLKAYVNSAPSQTSKSAKEEISPHTIDMSANEYESDKIQQPSSVVGMGNVTGLASMLKTSITASMLVCSTYGLVLLSNLIEQRVALPGAATAAITSFASILSFVVFNSKFGAALLSSQTKNTLTKVSSQLSVLCFHVFFASLGFSANVVQTASQYGLPTLAFCSIALSIHVALTGALSYGWNAMVRRLNPNDTNEAPDISLSLQDILVASNAAIGGPATAATFAGSISKGERSAVKRALVLSATFWGVAGYAFGTTIGVSFTKAMLSRI